MSGERPRALGCIGLAPGLLGSRSRRTFSESCAVVDSIVGVACTAWVAVPLCARHEEAHRDAYRAIAGRPPLMNLQKMST